MKHVFVTGADGFVGRHFCQFVESTSDWNVIAPAAGFDLRKTQSIAAALAAGPVPDAVLHLAAQSNVPQAFADPRATYDVNFFGTLALLEALKASRFAGRFLYIGTADIYGIVAAAELPVHEDHPLRPRNPYAVSKLAAESLVYQWAQTEGLDAVMVRPFNHIGPGQDERFAVAAFARQVADIALGRRPPRIDVGDIDVTRDFSDVRDIVRAYGMLLGQGSPGAVYNIGSGVETRLADILQTLIAIAGIEAEVVVDRSRLRPSEQRRMAADASAMRAVGWRPVYTLEQTLRDVYLYWKERLVNEQE